MKNISFIVIFLWISNAFSQNTVTGIIQSSSNDVLENVTIQILENNQYTTSNKQGFFEFKNVPNGIITFNFYLLGYETEVKQVKINNLTNQLSIVLIDKDQHLEEITLSAVFNKTQSQNVMKVEHETVNAMQKSGAISLMDGVTSIPGVSQVATGTAIGKPVIRGLSSNRVLVYAQGVRLENQQFGEEHGLGLSASGIESVEVIKGPASLLYGSDAIGGVLYFNPEKYATSDTIQGNISQQFFSNTQGTNTSIGLKSTQNNWKFLARANYSSQADYQVPNGDKIINTRAIEKDLKYGLGYANSHFATDFRYNYNNLNLGLPEEDLENEGKSKPLFPKQDIDNHILSLNQKVYFKNSKLEGDFGYLFNNRQEIEAVDVIALHMKLKTANYNIKYFLPKMGNFESIIGVQGMHQTNANFGEELLIPDAIVKDFGAFVTSTYSFTNDKVLQGGIRFDNRSITTIEAGTFGDEGYFAPIDKTFTFITQPAFNPEKICLFTLAD